MRYPHLSSLLLACLLLAACGPNESTLSDTSASLSQGRSDETTGIPEYPIEDFMGSTAYQGASFSADGERILLSHNRSGLYNVYSLATDGSGERQLTDSSGDAMMAVSYFPDDDRILYTADQGGNELNHLYVQDAQGESIDLTPGDNLKAAFVGWADDGASFFVQSNERDPRFFDVYEYRVETGYPREMIFRNEESFFPATISGDGRYLALGELISTNDNNLYVQDLQSGERFDITPHDEPVSSSPSDFSPDNRYFFYTTDQGSEFQQLMRYELATAEKESVLSLDWDVWYGQFSRDGNYLVAAANVDGRTELMMFDAESLEEVDAPEVEGVNVTSVSFSADDQAMAFYGSGSRFPSDLFVLENLQGEAEPRRLTSSLNENINPDHLVSAEVVRFDSYDGVEIPGILWTPHQASESNKAPALVWVHGGPGGQTRASYNGLIQYLVNHGYVVYGINNRGSSGYGKTFYAMDDRAHGEADLGDVVASKQMLIETGVVDPSRIGIIGGSYGGYMVVAALAFEPEAFEVGVDIFGVTNWLRTLESIPPWWEAQREALYTEMGDPATDRERLERISPLFHAQNIVKPMIVLQGANDPRVLQVESDEMVAAVRRNDVHVDYIVFPDEGHGFRNRDNQIDGYRAIREFLDRYL